MCIEHTTGSAYRVTTFVKNDLRGEGKTISVVDGDNVFEVAMGKFHFDDFTTVTSSPNTIKIVEDPTVGFYIDYFAYDIKKSENAKVGCFIPSSTRHFGTFFEENSSATASTEWKKPSN